MSATTSNIFKLHYILLQFGVTHTNNSMKSSVTIKWTPPDYDIGPIVFRLATKSYTHYPILPCIALLY